MQQGYETGHYGRQLVDRMRLSPAYAGWHVYYDHGDPTLDTHVAITKGIFGEEPKNLNRLADIDILIGSPDNIAQLLIEIEERPCSPKKLLGDILAILLCNQFAVSVHGKQLLFRVAPDTRLIVAGVVPDRGHIQKKIDEVISPRLQQLEGLKGGVSPMNVQLVFNTTIANTLEKLDQIVTTRFSMSAA